MLLRFLIYSTSHGYKSYNKIDHLNTKSNKPFFFQLHSIIEAYFIVHRSLNGWSRISFVHFWQTTARTRVRITGDDIKRGNDIPVPSWIMHNLLSSNTITREWDQISNKALKSFRYDFIFYGDFTHSIFYDYPRWIMRVNNVFAKITLRIEWREKKPNLFIILFLSF